MTPTSEQTGLRRSLSLTQVTLYGVGTTVGAGIYALIGKLAGVAGTYMPLSFLIAAVLVGFSALSFAELAARYPRAAGEATYVRAGFRSAWLSRLVGLMVVGAGLVSSSTIINGFVGYLSVFVGVPDWLAIAGIVVLLAAICIWGVGESVTVAGLITVLEVGGLLLVIWSGSGALATLPERWHEFVPTFDGAVWAGVMAGSFLAFYAFIGFEDMVNVAEEVRDVERVLPRAIMLTLVVTVLLYIGVAVVAVLNVTPAALQASPAPLALIYEQSGGSARLLSAIAVLAVVNGALVQMIMAARVLYGLARQDLLPAWFGRVQSRTQTPVNATLAIAAVILVAALAFDLVGLARATSYLTLTVFAAVNLSLVLIKLRDKAVPSTRVYPIWVPAIGALVSVAFLLSELVRQLNA